MFSLAPAPRSLRLAELPAVRARAASWPRCRLVPAGDGWSLVTGDEHVLFEADGPDGRRRCLEFARARGALAVFT
jgi:hypothetical protein